MQKYNYLKIVIPLMMTIALTNWASAQPPGLKKPQVAGIIMGSTRAEVVQYMKDKNISPMQRMLRIDAYPRLPKDLAHVQKAYLFFTKDQLSKVNIVFTVPHDTKNETADPILEYYHQLRDKLMQRYGNPTNSTAYVHPHFHYLLVALETGNAYYLDYWENADNMKILLSLKGGKGDINFNLTYQYIPLFETDPEASNAL